jgi:mono/diheme cytochrome c family protein
MKVIIGVVLAGTVSLAAVALIVYSGRISVAADEPHSRAVYRILETVRTRSVAVHSRNIQVPDLDDPELIAEGAVDYARMCSECHLAPGVTSSELRDGLYPKPPNLAEHVHASAAETFWMIKHGIKMTGMPAWGKTHSDEAIWGLVAFLQGLPQMTETDYRRATAAASHRAGRTQKEIPRTPDGDLPNHSHEKPHRN